MNFKMKTVTAGTVCVAAGALAIATLSGASPAAAVNGKVEPRTAVAKLVAFSVEDPAATAGLVGAPLPSPAEPIQAVEGLAEAPLAAKALISDSPRGKLPTTIAVTKAVERTAGDSAAAYHKARGFRINYRADVSVGDVKYRVEVVQPSEETLATGIEGPGNPGTVGDISVFNAETGPGESFATTVVVGSNIVTASGGTDPAARVELLQQLGLLA